MADTETPSPLLLRDWTLLQRQVIPPLLQIRARPAQAWSIGTTRDAVAVAVAYQHAQADDQANGDGSLESFTRDRAGDFDIVSFPLSVLRCIPDEARAECFVQDSGAWILNPDVAEQVVIGDPAEPVDLVTLRVQEGEAEAEIAELVAEAVEHLRPEGHLLVIGATTPPRVPADTLKDVSRSSVSNGGARLFRKRAGTRCRRASRSRSTGGAPVTLAHRNRQADLVQSHLRLARSLARRFARRGEAAEDLEQVALLGLVKAARRFDDGRQSAFSTYATVSILGELKRHFRDKTWMLRVPRSTQELYLAVKEAREELTHQLGTAPTTAEIAAHLECDEADVNDALRAADNFWPVSLDAGNPNEDGGSIEVPVVDENLSRAMDVEQLRRVLPHLDRRERLILRRQYFDERTQRQIAHELGISQMQVSRVSSGAHTKLRSWVAPSEPG